MSRLRRRRSSVSISRFTRTDIRKAQNKDFARPSHEGRAIILESNFLFPLGCKENKDERGKEKHHGIKEVTDDLKGTDGIAHRADSGDGDEQLCAVGEKALEDAGKGIEDRCRFFLCDAVFLGDLGGDGVCHDDSDGIVCRGDIHGADEKSNAKLTCALAAEDATDARKERFKAAILTDQLAEC